MASHRAFCSVLETYDLVFILMQLDALNKEKDIAAAQQSYDFAKAELIGRHDLVFSLRATCRGARAAFPLQCYVRN